MMGYDLMLLIDAGLDTVEGIGYTGREDKYVSAVQRFYNNYEKNRAKVEEYFENKDYENYAITVHALKSNARMIGAAELSRQFEELETAAKAGDRDTVDNKTASALASYGELMEKLRPIGGLGEVRASDEISGEEVRKTADELLAALDDFDDELSKKLASKLTGYPFRMTQMDKLTKARDYINDFMYDEAAEIIKEIFPAIE